MLIRRTCDNGVVVYESPLLTAIGVPHAFSTRIGGVSGGKGFAAFESLNLGNPNGQPVQDEQENIAENYRRLQAAIGCAKRVRWYAHQVHGATVLTSASATAGDCELGKADAIVSDDPGALAAVRTADCVPILLADRTGRRVAAVHAGWRGVIGEVVTAALRHFEDPAEVIAAIGPSIGFEAFEVGPEVIAAFSSLPLRANLGGGADFVRPVPGGKGYVDLRRVIALQLEAAGIPGVQIESTDRCTATHESEFFSHRRTGGLTGRMAAVIGAIG